MSFYFRQEIKCGKESSEHKKDQGNRGDSDEREFIEKEWDESQQIDFSRDDTKRPTNEIPQKQLEFIMKRA